MEEFFARINRNQPMTFGKAKVKIVSFVPNRSRNSPEITQNTAPPKDIRETAHDNSFSVTSKSLLSSKSIGPTGADHPKEMPYRNGPPQAVILEIGQQSLEKLSTLKLHLRLRLKLVEELCNPPSLPLLSIFSASATIR
jgi:hypothetical protein